MSERQNLFWTAGLSPEQICVALPKDKSNQNTL